MVANGQAEGGNGVQAGGPAKNLQRQQRHHVRERSTFRITACKPLIGWPSTDNTRMPRTHLPGVWPFMKVSNNPP